MISLIEQQASEYRFEPGDVLACFGTGGTSRRISLGTSVPIGTRRLRFAPSHLAIIGEHDGDCRWFESTTLSERPCVIQNKLVDGVQAHEPADRVRDYCLGRDWLGHGRVDVYRLSPIDRLDDGERELLSRMLVQDFLGVGYDTGGAMLAGVISRPIFDRFHWVASDLHSVFCNELVCAVLQRLGRMNKQNPGKHNPGSTVRELVQTGVYAWARTFEVT